MAFGLTGVLLLAGVFGLIHRYRSLNDPAVVPCSLTDPTDLMNPRRLAARAVWRGHLLHTGRIDPATQASIERGRALFLHEFTPAEGLGPHYNQRRCVACHATPTLLGGGSVADAAHMWGRDPALPLPPNRDDTGVPVRQHALPGFPPEVAPAGFVFLGIRVPPPLHGLGWIGAVSTRRILAQGDCDPLSAPPRSRCGHAIVRDRDRPSLRFSTRATVASIEEFVASALEGEMGLQTEFFLDHAATPEVSSQQILDLANFVGLSPAPTPETPPRGPGAGLFQEAGCAVCHVPAQTVEGELTPSMYTDLLTHDLGPALADRYPNEGIPADRFRTTPLWGLRNRPGPYLHDGSGATLEQAIERHGGDARTSVVAFHALSEPSRLQLMGWLRQL